MFSPTEPTDHPRDRTSEAIFTTSGIGRLGTAYACAMDTISCAF
jgi:hypothetical protein